MITIKPIEESSFTALNELYAELSGAGPTDPGKTEKVFRAILHNPDYHLLGAYVDGELLGSMMGIICMDLVMDCRPFMVVENVVVSSRARRLGLGRQLIHALEDIARGLDCFYIMLVSGEKRKEAHIFYEQMGYKDEKVQGFRKHLSSH
ncbi:GNAT family N-acetyltransferase [Paenibacillus sp. NFR01]|uniref:GNAT family N-acetyltransferase n=1 Tax=Paenibacillus sp. NFR01 TaxID=1566279 RepID=UPI0008B4EDC3|nr:GNAT family N-acetyltransferase [Paenibacillus sp. NFR01]SET13957.1 Ribosomal protein S18 acetylase RimI [Paenibacillus sp. NFR01]